MILHVALYHCGVLMLIQVKKLLYVICLCLFALTALAADYHISQTASGDQSGSDNGNLCTMATANAGLSAGETGWLYNNGGTITTAIDPANNGSSGNVITFSPAAGEVVVMSAGIYLKATSAARQYITVDGLNAGGSSLEIQGNPVVTGSWVSMHNEVADARTGYSSNYNIIQNVAFTASPSTSTTSNTYYGVSIRCDAAGNQIIDNSFTVTEVDSVSGSFSDHIYIKSCNSGTVTGNIISGNTSLGSSHGSIVLAGYGGTLEKTVIRNNTLTVRYHAGINLASSTSSITKTLIEGNTIAGSGSYCSEDACGENFRGSSGDKARRRYDNNAIQHSAKYSIIRGNTLWNDLDIAGSGAGTGISFFGDSASDQNLSCRIYHNTWHNFHIGFRGYAGGTAEGQDNGFVNNIFDTMYGSGYYVPNGVSDHHRYKTEGQVHWWTNNLFSSDESDIQYNDGTLRTSQTPEALSIASSDWTDNIAGDPDFTDSASGDFTLASVASDAIDAGAALTTTTNAATGTALTVADGYYFYDGWGISGETGDYIYIEDTGKVQVSAITGDAITLTAVATWTSGKNVYFCPWGVCFSGVAPDIGAEEYALQVYAVVPPDGGVGINTTLDATWSKATSVDDADVWFASGACAAACDGAADDAAQSSPYDLGTMTINTTYCLEFKANDGTEQGDCQQFEFTTTGGPPAPIGSKTSISYSSGGGSITHDDSGITIE